MNFFARADGASVFLTQDEAVIAWASSATQNSRAVQKSESVFRLQFVGASGKAAVSGENELPGKTNYLLGNDPRHWHTDVPHFSAVSYSEIYPGVDARLYGGSLGLEYDLSLSPGADYQNIILRAANADRLRLDTRGNLLVRAADREILMRRPRIFQLDGKRKISIEGGYRLLSDNSFGFRVGPHRRDLPLLIDPSISVTYTSFLGGNGAEKGNSVAVDSTGVVYVGGTTTDIATFPESSPTKLGPLAGTSKLFVAKVDTTQSGAASLVYLTFIGGSGDDEGSKVAVDNSTSPPSLAILGWTTSTDFPVTNSSTLRGPSDLTISKLNGAGNAFTSFGSMYFGGTGSEATQSAAGVATDSTGNVYVTSDTTSTDLPQLLVPNGFHLTYGGGVSDGFLAVFGATTGSLTYSTYFGINGTVGSTAVALDSTGNAYVVGYTSSGTGFPTTNAFQSAGYAGGSDDAFIIQINANPGIVPPLAPIYASLLGGSGTDQAFAVALDGQSPPSAYVTGSTSSTDFVPSGLQPNSFQPCFGAPTPAPCSPSAATSNAFFAVVSQTATTFIPSLAYASYLGGTKLDSGQAVAVVSTSNVLVAGKATSSDFPIFCPSQNFTGTQDAFLASFNPMATGSASLLVSSLLGGSRTAAANAVAADTSGNAILFGDTGSSDYPLGANPNPNNGFQPTCTSCALGSPQPDAFLTKTSVSTAASGCISFNPASENFGSFPVGSNSVPPFNALVTNSGNASVNLTSVTIGGTNSADFQILPVTNCTASTVLAAGGTCSVSIGFVPSVAGAESATLQISDTGANSPQQNLDLTGTGTAPEVSLSPNTGLTFGSVPQGTTSSAQIVTVNNTGNSSLTISSITIDPTVGAPNGPGSFGLPATTNACSTASPVLAGGSCNIAVNFTPQATGSLLGQVDINDDANNTSGGAVQTIALSGTGTTPTPLVGLSPTSIPFGNQNLGTTSTPQSITVSNTGSATLNFTNIQLTGVNANQYQIVSAGTTCQVGIGVPAPSGSCTIEVEFAPTAAASANAAVTLTDDANPTTQSVTLTGTGTGAVASYSANSMSFGGVNVGTTSSPQTVTLTNTGNITLTISNVAKDPSVGIPADFALLTSGTPCQTVGSLAPSASCTITVSFTPSVQGTITGQIDINDNAFPASQTIPLDGTGLQFGVSLSSNSIAFGTVSVGATSTPSSVTLTNTGNQPLTVSSVTIDSTVGTPSDFAFTGTNDCIASSPLAANATCTITLDFAPAAPGVISGQVDVADNGPGSPQLISLTGTGTQPAASFSPPSSAFGSVNVGTPSSPQTVTLTNTGNQTLTISSVTVDPSVGTPADFSLSGTSSCLTAGSLAPSGSCSIIVTFTPSAQGSESAQIDVADNAPGSPQLVPMSGTGTAVGVSLSPSSLPFANTSVNSSSAVMTSTLSNTGNLALAISSLTITGANPTDFVIVSNQTTCPTNGSVSAGNSCVIAVQFAPQSSGPLSSSVSITDNAASSPQTIALSGTGTQPNVQFSPTAMPFGSVNTGTTSTPVTVTLTNTGNQSLTISSVTINPSVGTPSDFAFTTTSGSNTCATIGSLAANGTCTITVTFTPAALGAITGEVDVADDAPGTPQIIPLSGTGTAPGVSFNPTSLTFPSTSVGNTSSAKTITLTNTGTSSLSIFSITTIGLNAGDFLILSSPQTTCPSSGSLAANSSCIIAVDFAPTASGSRFASVSVTDNAAGSPQTVALSGTGTQPVATLSSNSMPFGSVNVSTTSAPSTVTLTNTGNQSLTISSVKINPSVGTPGDFALSGPNTCSTAGSLPPAPASGSSCTISVTFTPAAQGPVSGEVDITDTAPTSPQTISLSGTGTAPGVSLTPSSLNLGSEDIGSTSTAQNATLKNTGSGPLTINSITFTGANPGDFGETNNCPLSPQQLASQNSCIISVTFSPSAKGARSASLSVSDTGPASPQKVAVSGTGTQPVVAFNPSSGISFPSTIVGTASGTRPLTVTNTGDGPLDISSITFMGTNPGDFSETDNCAGPANDVAPQKSCTINVNFTPTASGARAATLIVNDNAASPSQQVTVGGQATDFQLAPSGGSTSATITAGETAIFPLQVTPQNGFTGTVNFGCTNPPPKGTCTVSPPSVQITGSTPVSFSVSVGTTSNAVLIPPSLRPSPGPRFPAILWLFAALLCFFFWRRSAAQNRRRLVPRFILAFAVLLLASCGSKGSGNPGGNGTPPGTYTVTATGSVGSGAARTRNLIVTVQ
ncbi:MAG TPA: choice-of-anchor D domain-containing protein [Candidatus Acidoferrales bacterium]|nr:choice-of-anchor D domain-containing protein [Candidatus Acidoferrales bacterium]